MPEDLDQLVADVSVLTGASRPAWMVEDAPLLAEQAVPPGTDFYLVGLIGGKEVGKSALVNALVGREITAQTSHGPGTETVIAYVHRSRESALRDLLQLEAPGSHRIVPHDLPHLARQVLLDLPDIDSHYADHVALTRKMLRHMLFPVWMQSVEKYADFQPQELLRKVAAGNAPANFVFCLNKVDQLNGRAEALTAPVRALQEDYAGRLARVLELPAPPRVWAIAALRPQAFELPELRALLAQQKSEAAVRESRLKAALRRRASILEWLEKEDLPARAGRLRRLLDEAQETVNDRLGGPLLDTFLPHLTDDPAYRQAIIDDCLARRTARYPILGALHGIFFAIGTLIRRNVEARARRSLVQDGESLVETHLRELATPTADALEEESGRTEKDPAAPRKPVGRSVASLVQTTFALLQQSHPSISPLYQDQKLWESMPASLVAGELRQTLARTIDRQRALACSRLDAPGGRLMFLWRSLLTIGAVIWLIFLWPLLQVLVQPPASALPGGGILFRIVQSLGPAYLLTASISLVIYFTALWLVLRWDTQRRVQRQFANWRQLEGSDGPDASLNLVTRTMQWMSDLLDPVRTALARVEATADRVEAVRTALTKNQPN